jgi:hypothetical protein
LRDKDIGIFSSKVNSRAYIGLFSVSPPLGGLHYRFTHLSVLEVAKEWLFGEEGYRESLNKWAWVSTH